MCSQLFMHHHVSQGWPMLNPICSHHAVTDHNRCLLPRSQSRPKSISFLSRALEQSPLLASLYPFSPPLCGDPHPPRSTRLVTTNKWLLQARTLTTTKPQDRPPYQPRQPQTPPLPTAPLLPPHPHPPPLQTKTANTLTCTPSWRS
jgi:hypothetical protein